MPAGEMPTYEYRPAIKPTDPVQLRTCSSRRSRLWAGGNDEDPDGTYFRSREPGGEGNKLSVELIEYSETEAYLISVNHIQLVSENVSGPVQVKYLDLKLAWNEQLEINNLTTTPTAKINTIRVEISGSETVISSQDLGVFIFDKLFAKGKIAVQLTKNSSGIAPDSVVIVRNRYKSYPLVVGSETITDPDTGESTTISGWDIEDLRTKVNASDPWIEMLERSGTEDDGSGTPPIPNPNPADIWDEGVDGSFIYPFPQTFLTGGDGLPDSPVVERTGPSRSIIHVNYGETHNGTLGEVNTVYEWAGDSATSGFWKSY